MRNIKTPLARIIRFINKNKDVESLSLKNKNIGDLEDWQIQIVMKKLVYMPNLKSLDLSYNNFKYIDFNQFPNLEELNLSNNNFTHIDFNQLPNLITLHLDHNKLKTAYISDNLYSLEQLTISNNKLGSFSLLSQENSILSTLDLSNNELTTISLLMSPENGTILKNLIITNNPNLEHLNTLIYENINIPITSKTQFIKNIISHERPLSNLITNAIIIRLCNFSPFFGEHNHK